MSAVTTTPGTARPAARAAFFDLVARVAHDLNNHLATILGKAEIAMMVDDPQRWRRGIEESYQAGQRARAAVADLQRVQGWVGAETPDPAPLAEVLELARRLAGRSLARLGLEPAIVERSGAIVADPAPWTLALWQVLSDRARRCEQAPAAGWTLEAVRRDGGIAITLIHPGTGADAPEGFGTANELAGGIDAAVRLVESCGGTLVSSGETTRLELPL